MLITFDPRIEQKIDIPVELVSIGRLFSAEGGGLDVQRPDADRAVDGAPDLDGEVHPVDADHSHTPCLEIAQVSVPAGDRVHRSGAAHEVRSVAEAEEQSDDISGVDVLAVEAQSDVERLTAPEHRSRRLQVNGLEGARVMGRRVVLLVHVDHLHDQRLVRIHLRLNPNLFLNSSLKKKKEFKTFAFDGEL